MKQECTCGWTFIGNIPPIKKCPRCKKELGPSNITTETKLERQKRIKKKVALTDKLIKQIQSLSAPEDKGLGDTIARIRTDKPTNINKTITRLLASCSCKLEEAVDVLNERYPNARNIIQSDSSGSST